MRGSFVAILFQKKDLFLYYMKRIILLLMCVFTLSCVSAQTQKNNKKRNMNGDFRVIETWVGESVLPSFRSEKHLDHIKKRDVKPYQIDKSSLSRSVKRYKRKTRERVRYDRITFFDLNYAYSLNYQHSFGLTFGQVRRFGYYVNAMTGFKYLALNADVECDKNGYVDGEMQYYSGRTSNSRYSVICGLMFRVAKPIALKVGAGYGGRALAWETGDNLWFRNSYYSNDGFEYNAGLQIFMDKINISFDYIGNSYKIAEIRIGLGININK